MANKLKDTSIESLQSSVMEQREKLRTIRFGGAGSRSRNVREARTIKRDVARSLTELRARALAQSKAAIAPKAKTA